MPRLLSNCAVWRVSSAAMQSTSANMRAARALISSRLPMGVETISVSYTHLDVYKRQVNELRYNPACAAPPVSVPSCSPFSLSSPIEYSSYAASYSTFFALLLLCAGYPFPCKKAKAFPLEKLPPLFMSVISAAQAIRKVPAHWHWLLQPPARPIVP